MSFDALTQTLSGVHAIEASAGTGKTYSITVLWLRLLIEEQMRVDQVLVTTFTRAATAELKDRLLGSLRRALAVAKGGASAGPEATIIANVGPHLGPRNLVRELETALSSFDLAPIHTIHGFCQSLINRHALELGCDPGMDQTENAEEILGQIVSDKLMRDADQDAFDLGRALEVAQAVAKNPLALIPDPVSKARVAKRSHELVDPLLRRIAPMKIPATTSNAIVRKLEALRDGGKFEKLSEAQKKGLGPQIVDQIGQVAAEVETLHHALMIARLHPIAALVRDQFADRKAAANVRTFDDILLTVHRSLHGGEDGPLVKTIRARFKAVIIDECQDSDSVQIEVFQRLFREASAFLVIGDPKQSIYRFRGADLGSYQGLVAGAHLAPDMRKNFRSDRPLVDAINRLYAGHQAFRGGTKGRPIRYVEVEANAPEARIADPKMTDPVLLVWSEETDRARAKRDLARRTAEEFSRLLASPVTIVDRNTGHKRRLEASDLAVLATTHGDLALVRSELQARGIACEQAGSSLGSVWESEEAVDVQAWLEAVHALHERSDPLAAMLAFAATPLVGLRAIELVSLGADPKEQAALAQPLLEDGGALRFEGPLPRLKRWWEDADRIGVRLGSWDGERRMTNWRHVGCLLQAEWATGRQNAGDLALWLSRMRAQGGTGGEQELMKLETDLPAVQLATVFAAKGLEYPVVACPFLWHVKSRLKRKGAPHAIVRRPEGAIVDIGSAAFEQHLDEALTQEDDEQERVLYVALTRARHRLYVGLAPVDEGAGHENGAERSALARLLGIEKVDKGDWSSRCTIPRLAIDRVQAMPAARDHHGASGTALAPAPEVNTHRGGLVRCLSYSALTRSENSAVRDHDPEDRTKHQREPGLLGRLNLTGNRLGNRVHGLLEDILGNGRPFELAVEHMDAEWKIAIGTILETPIRLGSETVTLSMIRPRAIAEMHAMLPVRMITPANVSKAILRDPLISGDADRRAWAEGLARLDFSALYGFFQGYIDLIFEHQGRFYIVDYKTNVLSGYDNASLEEAMLDHHYVLQGRLYAVALHRHLAATMPGYDPDKHLGGCAYLFLRGFPDRGVWFERPDIAALGALNDLFAEPAP
jgi:exodeoxyribonuclease V beta subunit